MASGSSRSKKTRTYEKWKLPTSLVSFSLTATQARKLKAAFYSQTVAKQREEYAKLAALFERESRGIAPTSSSKQKEKRVQGLFALRAVVGLHPYAFSRPGDVVVSLNETLRGGRGRAILYTEDHNAELIAPRYDQFGRPDWVDDQGTEYRRVEGDKTKLFVRVPATHQSEEQKAQAAASRWGVAAPGSKVTLRSTAIAKGRGAKRSATIRGAFFKQKAGGSGIRRTGYVTIA